MTQLLVSVRNAAEAEAAIAGGAAIIDVKEPSRGALGRADFAVCEEVVRVVAGRRPVSAALGELHPVLPEHFCESDELLARSLELGQWDGPPYPSGVVFVKFGLSQVSPINWRHTFLQFRRSLEARTKAKMVAVAYADWRLADSPQPYDVMKVAIQGGFTALLFDTWSKKGRSLLDWMSVKGLAEICRHCREANVLTVLAGSLKKEQIVRLLPANPDYFGVRGSACRGNDRLATIDAERVAELAALLSPPC